MAFLVSGRPLDLLFTWLALSGAACLLERIGQEPLSFNRFHRQLKEEKTLGCCGQKRANFTAISRKRRASVSQPVANRPIATPWSPEQAISGTHGFSALSGELAHSC